MSVNVFARRLTQLEALLTTLPEGEYNHKSWRTCAIGHAMKRRDIFRGLNINLVDTPDSCDGAFMLKTDTGISIGMDVDDYVNAYFGPNAFDSFASGLLTARGGSQFSNPSREDTILNIQEFRDNLLAEAA